MSHTFVTGPTGNRKNRPCQAIHAPIPQKLFTPFTDDLDYKVSETTNMSQLLTPHISDTRAGSRFLPTAQEQESLRGVRADRDGDRRASRLRDGVDRGDALLQWRRPQDEPGEGHGWPSAAAPHESLPA